MDTQVGHSELVSLEFRKEKKRRNTRYIAPAIFSTFQVARFLTRLQRVTLSLNCRDRDTLDCARKLVLMTRLFGYAALREYRNAIDFCGEDRLPIRAN